MCYNSSCLAYRNGAFFIHNADGFNNSVIVDKAPFISGLSSRCMLDTSAANEGRFVMTIRDGKPCKRCGNVGWYKSGNCKHCHQQRVRDWQSRNYGRVQDLKREYAEKHPERIKGSDQRYRELSREKAIAKTQRYRTRKTQAGGSYTAAEFKTLCNQYDNRCLACGKKRALTPDHIIPVALGGSSDITNIQPLCLKCNKRKGTNRTDHRTKKGILRWIQEKLL